MTYCIVDIIYGWNLTDHPILESPAPDEEGDNMLDFLKLEDSEYFHHPYYGNGDYNYGFGVHLGEFSEGNPVEVSKLQLQPTEDQIKELAKAVEGAQYLKEVFDASPAKVLFIFGSS